LVQITLLDTTNSVLIRTLDAVTLSKLCSFRNVVAKALYVLELTYICGVKRNLLRNPLTYPNACRMLDFGDVQETTN
jgi:hypothetical protein